MLASLLIRSLEREREMKSLQLYDLLLYYSSMILSLVVVLWFSDFDPLVEVMSLVRDE